MASSPSLSGSWLYHVFLSFRGGDVRKGFLSHVQKELRSKGIIAFIDDEMERGQPIDAELIGAIRKSRIAIVLLSSNYASSSWCLDELVEIMKCMKENQQKVIPIFYEVDPSDVSDQMGDFGKAFDETCVGKKEEKAKQAWRQALKDVAGIAGYASSNCNEANLINKVASNVTAVLGFTPSKDFDDYVGVEARAVEIKSKMSLQSEQVKVIVVVGPVGIGKTTIARVLYNQLSPDFPFNTFLENIRGNYEKPCGNDYQLKLRLQKKLLAEIFNQKEIEVRHLGVAQQRLSDKKVLVVLDEVDSWWQLEATAYQREWFGPGSIIIITTEDRKLLKTLRLGIDHIYEMKFPTKDESLQIFCQYAFGQKSPEKGFEELAWEVTGLAGDLPLGLRVMGSYLQGMSRNEWIEALPWLRSTLDREIESTLRFSYDALRDNERALFLHIACFFDGSTVDSFKRCLADSRLEVNYGLQLLAHKSLLSVKNGYVKMHSLLKQMGREIVKKQSLEEREFLMDTKEISDVLEEDTGTGKVLGIFLNTLCSERRKIQISKSVLDGMNNLQFLKVSYGNLCIPKGLNCLPDKLRFIHWNGCPMRFWPSKFSGKFLVELIMTDSSFEKLWEGIKPLQCLKLMDLSMSLCLKEIPDLSKATSLEKLDLHGCKNLLELTSSIGNATKLTICNFSSCWLLKELPSSIGSLINLEELDLSFCLSLKAFSVFSILEKISGCSTLKKLNLGYTVIEEVPSSINTWSCLYRLDMSGCRNLKEFPNVSDNIVELVLCNTGIEEVPPWIENLFRLRELVMDGCQKLKNISPNISKLENLELLSLCIGKDDGLFQAVIEQNPKLRDSWRLLSNFSAHYILPICLPEKALSSPVSLSFHGDGLKTIPDCIGHLSELSKLDISDCKELVALPKLPGSLISLNAEDCKILKRIESPFQNPNISLNFAYCFNLNQKARKLIQTSACKYAVLPGEEVPTHFPHRASSSSLTINLTPKSLPSSFRFKTCILLSEDNNNLEDHNDDDDDDDEKDEKLLLHVSCCIRGKQNGLTVRYGSNQLHHRPDLHLLREHLYIFEDSLCLHQDF